jgi:hypothetical protein
LQSVKGGTCGGRLVPTPLCRRFICCAASFSRGLIAPSRSSTSSEGDEAGAARSQRA